MGFFQNADKNNSIITTVNGMTRKLMVFERIKNMLFYFLYRGFERFPTPSMILRSTSK